MATKHLVRVGASARTSNSTGADARTGARHDTTCRCTCGWSVTLGAPTAELAVQVAARARANHLEDAHPDQAERAGALEDQHALMIGAPVKRDHLWTRHAVCACGWSLRTTERSPDRVAAVVRSRHRDHLRHETGRSPVRDYVVLLALIAIIGVLMIGLATAAIHAGTA